MKYQFKMWFKVSLSCSFTCFALIQPYLMSHTYHQTEEVDPYSMIWILNTKAAFSKNKSFSMVVIQFSISRTTIRKMAIEFSSELNKKNEENAFRIYSSESRFTNATYLALVCFKFCTLTHTRMHAKRSIIIASQSCQES